jgi:hypothetical protein
MNSLTPISGSSLGTPRETETFAVTELENLPVVMIVCKVYEFETPINF